MTLYYVFIGSNEYQVEISKNHSKINGETIQAALVELGERGLYLLKKGTWKQEMHVQAQGNNQYSMNANGKHVIAKVEKSNGRTRRRINKTAAGDMKAPISGIVVKVNVEEGQQVSDGDVVIVLESMKMQMLMRAPVSGIVKSVHVKLGSQLAKEDFNGNN